MTDEITKRAHVGIIGLMPRENAQIVQDGWWPTHGYDGQLAIDADGPIEATGYARAEWLALADEMIARWKEWRAHVEGIP